MSFTVNDDAVREFADRLRRGESTANVFPAKMSECDFTPEQRVIINAARREKKAYLKTLRKAAQPPPDAAPAAGPHKPAPQKNAPSSKPHPPALQSNAPAKKPNQPNPPKKAPAQQPHTPTPPKASGLKKLDRLLYIQKGKCFFCGEVLKPGDATIEHLHPLSKGGQRIESNEVVCHRSLNEAFGAMDLKSKFAFILESSGSFRCP